MLNRRFYCLYILVQFIETLLYELPLIQVNKHDHLLENQRFYKDLKVCSTIKLYYSITSPSSSE